jgi:hypothetical protein
MLDVLPKADRATAVRLPGFRAPDVPEKTKARVSPGFSVSCSANCRQRMSVT